VLPAQRLNGGAGKTQLCRRLRDLPFDPKIPTTHGIQVGQMTFGVDGFPEPVRLNLWDFDGQDIYHGSHALFLHRQAIFLVLWTPELEQGETYKESALTLRHRPLSYWLDYPPRLCRDRCFRADRTKPTRYARQTRTTSARSIERLSLSSVHRSQRTYRPESWRS
jgi:GTPase SAR1 family protein